MQRETESISKQRGPADDPSAVGIAKVYARAVVEAASAAGNRDEVIDELGQVVHDLLPAAPGALAVFDSPRIDVAEKQALLAKLLEGRVLQTTLHVLQVLARHGRLGLLPAVLDAAKTLADSLSGRTQAVFTTAAALEEPLRSETVAAVEQSTGLSISPSFTTDPALIGGLVVRIGDTIYDKSVATGLHRLAARLSQRSSHEIQHRRDRLGTP